MKQPELGRKILDLRKQSGLTQEELVEKCNISVRTIQRIEAGEVTPRYYTVKTILAALGHEFNSIHGLNLEDNRNSLENLKAEQPEKISRAIQTITIACISGILYFLLGFVEFAADWNRWFENSMIFSNGFYIAVKVSVLISFSLFIVGFVELGVLFKNGILKLASLAMILFSALFYGYEILSLYYEIIPFMYFLGFMAVLFGAIGIVFGLGIIQLKHTFGNFATLTGAAEIFMSTLFITVVLALIGYFVLTIVILLQIIFLYKVLEKLKD